MERSDGLVLVKYLAEILQFAGELQVALRFVLAYYPRFFVTGANFIPCISYVGLDFVKMADGIDKL